MHAGSPEGEGEGREARELAKFPALLAELTKAPCKSLRLELFLQDFPNCLLHSGVVCVVALQYVVEELGR